MTTNEVRSIHSRGGVPAATVKTNCSSSAGTSAKTPLQLVGEQLEPRPLGVAELDHDIGPFRFRRAHPPDGVLEVPDVLARSAIVEGVAHSLGPLATD